MPAEHGMSPLRVVAELSEPVSFSFGTVALDALLASQVARRDGRPPMRRGEPSDYTPVPPIAPHPSGYYLASWALPGRLAWSMATHIHKPAPADWYLRLCTGKVRRIDIGTGPDKAYRLPRHRQRFTDLTWWCIGDAEAIRLLLLGVTRVGSHRRDGIGKVRSWTVEPCDTWDGFPVMRDGIPLRSLPLDTSGLSTSARSGYAALRFPYWEPLNQEMVAIP